jgi:hypothetical protein
MLNSPQTPRWPERRPAWLRLRWKQQWRAYAASAVGFAVAGGVIWITRTGYIGEFVFFVVGGGVSFVVERALTYGFPPPPPSWIKPAPRRQADNLEP